MLIQGHIFLVFVLLAIGATVLWIFISQTNTKWLAKAIVTSMLLLAIASAWLGLRAIYGFPYDNHPNNENYYLVGSYIVEPDPKRADKGNIYLWLIPKKEANKKMDWLDRLGLAVNTDQPRAWVIPYTRAMHKQLRGLDKQRNGGAIAVKIGKKKKKGQAHQGDGIEDRQKFVPYILPESFKPSKEYNMGSPPPPEANATEGQGAFSDGWLGDYDEEASMNEQNSNTSDGTPDMQSDIGIGIGDHIIDLTESPDGTPTTNNNTQEQQLPTDKGGSSNAIP